MFIMSDLNPVNVLDLVAEPSGVVDLALEVDSRYLPIAKQTKK